MRTRAEGCPRKCWWVARLSRSQTHHLSRRQKKGKKNIAEKYRALHNSCNWFRYPCSWDGIKHGFNTGGGGPGDVEYSGRTDAEKDASCCARCDCEPLCEFWERDTDSNKCSLRRNFVGYDNKSTGTRGMLLWAVLLLHTSCVPIHT